MLAPHFIADCSSVYLRLQLFSKSLLDYAAHSCVQTLLLRTLFLGFLQKTGGNIVYNCIGSSARYDHTPYDSAAMVNKILSSFLVQDAF